MSQYFQIHATHPQQRLVRRAADIIHQGGVVAYPTDSGFALGCHIDDKQALDRVCQIRQVDRHHNFTLMCRDLSEISVYAKVSNSNYRVLKAHTPGAFTFILLATRDVPRRIQHAKRKTIGIRVPDHLIVQDLLSTLGQPLTSCSLILPGQEQPLAEAEEIRALLEKQVDLVIDGGTCLAEPTTVVGLLSDVPELIRSGSGDTSWLEY